MSLSAVLAGDTPKSKKFRLSTRTEILRKSIPLQKMDVGAFSRDCFHTYYFTEEVLRVSIYGKNKLMGASSGLAFVALLTIMDRLGMLISCVLVRAGVI